MTRPNVTRAILGGFIGTLAMTMMMYLIAPMMGVKMDIAGSLVLLPFKRLKSGPAVRGITWGVVLWLMAQLLVMPMIGTGVFSSKMGGMMAVAASFMAHIVYGGLLGGISGPAVAHNRGSLNVEPNRASRA